MNFLIQKNRKRKALYFQLLFVTLAFALMVISSSLYVRNILLNQLNREAEETLTKTKLQIETTFVEPQTTLIIVSNTLRSMIMRGESEETVYRYLKNIDEEMNKKMGGFSFDGIFGYFESYGGVFFHSGGWQGETDYDPTIRPWYKTAIDAGDKMAVTPIYYGLRSNQFVITYVQRLFDNEGKPLAIVCLNMPIDQIRNTIMNMHIAKSGYGILINTNLEIVAHPSQDFLGKSVDEFIDGIPEMQEELKSGKVVFERELVNYLGHRSIIFSLRLDNGWVLTLMTPKDEYYNEMKNMTFIIGILGVVFAMVLIIILIRIDNKKNKADALLADMEKLREAEIRTQLMLDATPLGCKLWDRNLNIIECNQEALKLFDIQNKQDFFSDFFKLSPEYQPCGRLSTEMAAEYVNEAFDKGYCRFEWAHQKLNGEAIPSEITLVRIKYMADYAIAGYIRDLREQKQMMREIESALKEAQEANAAKSKFLATMSHEIRTPMNVILGVAESNLLIESHPKEIKESFEKVYDSGNLLLNIINDILDLSKIEAGKFELNPINYEILSLINDTVNLNVVHYGHKQIDFKLEVDENIPLRMFGDELRIKQIFNNLLSNAFKYTNSGEIVLSLSIEKQTQNSNSETGTLIIKVSDTGQGMSQEQIEKIFDEYSRFNLEINRTAVGTGLGMTITRNLVRMMNGDISVKSTPGKGTTIIVRIPQGIIGSDLLGKKTVENMQKFGFAKATRDRHIKITREPMPYGKVLVVDDMQSNLDVAKLLLNPYKLQIDTAESGFKALDLIKSGNVYDMVFMDHMMPKMDGIETVKKLRELGYKHPILALTANAVIGQQEMFLANGFDGFISKPIDLRQLNDSLNKFIRDKERKQKPAEEQSNEDSAFTIRGVDTKTGLALYNGDADIYLAVLRSFIPNAIKVMDKLRNVSEETLPDYTVNIHGLKGISAGIGAEKTREAAYNLEMAAKSGNLSKVLSENESILQDTEDLVLCIKTWLEEQDNKNPKPQLAYPDRLLLARLRKSCEAYDMKGIDEVMDELESADYQTDASLVTWLREKINIMDFSSAASRLSLYEEETT